MGEGLGNDPSYPASDIVQPAIPLPNPSSIRKRQNVKSASLAVLARPPFRNAIYFHFGGLDLTLAVSFVESVPHEIPKRHLCGERHGSPFLRRVSWVEPPGHADSEDYTHLHRFERAKIIMGRHKGGVRA